MSDPQRTVGELPRRALPDPEDEPTITIEDAGTVLGIGRSSAYAAARRGDLPTITIGRRKVVPTARLRAMLGMAASGGEGHGAAA